MRRRNGFRRVIPLVPFTALIAFAFFADVAVAQERRPVPQREVVFIGFNHTAPFLQPGFSPAHIRALLSKIGPVALCIETSPGWARSAGIPTFPQEKYASITWAEREGIPFHAVDDRPAPWLMALAPIQRMEDTVTVQALGKRFEEFRGWYGGMVKYTAALAFAETAEDIESWQRNHYHPLVVEQWPQEDSAAAVRDDRIAENIRGVLAKYPGKRVAVLYGSGHYLPLKRRLESRGDVRLIPPLRYFPLEPERVRAGWHPDDALVLLGANLDDFRTIAFPQNRNHQRTKELLDRLRRERPGSAISRYYEARWRMLFRDYVAAIPLLREVAEGQGATVLPYIADWRWHWPPLATFEQRAQFFLAASYDMTGDRAAAEREYQALLNRAGDQLVVRWSLPDLPVRHIDLRPYIASFLRTPYQGGILEAYRAALAMEP